MASNDFSAFLTNPVNSVMDPTGVNSSITGNLDPISMLTDPQGFLSGLFGGGGGGFKGYTDANGNYVWGNPSQHVPVPTSTIPGSNIKPTPQYRQQANQISALTTLLPYFSKAIAGQIIPQAQAQLTAQQAVSPGLNQLLLDMYKQYGPQLNQVGNQIAQQNALAQVGTDTAALNQAQTTEIPALLKAQQTLDPEYYATRALTASRLSDLMKSINLSPNLSGSELDQIQRQLAQINQSRGTANSPSALATTSDAMTFGAAGNARLQQNIGNLSNAVSAATASLPTFKSGQDAFQVATGRSSVPNAGAAQFGGVDNSASTIAQNLMGIGTGMQSNMQGNTNLTQQLSSQHKDWADYLNQVTSSIGNLTGSASKIGGMIA